MGGRELLDCEGKKAVGGIVYTDWMPAEADNNGFYRRWVPAGLPDKINIYTGNNIQYQLPENLVQGQTYQVPPILNYGPIKAMAYVKDDKAEIYAYLNDYQNSSKSMEYSMDGISWQNDKIFVGMPYREDYDCWVRVIGTNCPIQFKVKRIEAVLQDCGLLPESILHRLLLAYTSQQYIVSLGSPTPYHGIGVSGGTYSDFVNNFGLMGCLNAIQIHRLNNPNFEVDFELLSQLKNLQDIDMQYCNVKNPQLLGKFSNAVFLKFYQCNISSLSSEIGNLTKLRQMDLGICQVTELPNSIGNLTNLTTLFLEENKLTQLPSSIGNLTNLNSLNIAMNKLTQLPSSMGNLTNLDSLDIAKNRLTQLPSSIGNLTKLRWLDIGWNTSLTSLPPEIVNLKDNLRELNLRGCPISPTEQAKIRAWLPNTTISF